MSKYNLYIGSLVAGPFLVLTGFFYWIQHRPGWGDIMGTGLLFSLYWFIAGITGVFRNKTLTPGQRVLWLAGFLVLTFVAGFLWYFRILLPEKKKQLENG